MDWFRLTEAAIEPELLRHEVRSTARAAEEARLLGDRDTAIRLIEQAYAVLDLLTASHPRAVHSRLSNGEETAS